jgi:hypothetical protein
MTFSLEGYLLVVAVFGVGLWLLLGVARLNVSWRVSQMETAALRQQRTDDAKLLLTQVEEMMKLDAELKEIRKRGSMVQQANEIKKGNLASMTPLPPPAIYITSEFPPSSRDKPYVAQLRRTTAVKSRRADDPVERHVLVWAQDHSAAVGRAHSALSAHSGYAADSPFKLT